MGITAMEITLYIQKTLFITSKTCYRSACKHPFIVSMLLFFLFLYKFLPFFFFFLVSSSPVIGCTAVLLGTLLSFGDPYIPELDEKDEEEEEEEKVREPQPQPQPQPHHGISLLKSGGVGNELVVEKDGSFSVENYVEEKGRELKVGNLSLLEKPHGEDESVSGSSDEGEDLEKVVSGEKGGKEEDEDKPLMGGESDDVVQYTNLREEIGVEKVGSFGSVQYSSILKGDEDNEESSEYDSDSDWADSSSPDASLAEILPMLDELHPLLDSELSQPGVVEVEDEEDVASDISEGSSSDGSEEEVDKAGIEDDEEEEEEKQGGKDEETKAVVTWTKEDEKNLMDLGNSELERNRRLESLIARRRSRKSLRMMMTEKNLIDLDSSDPSFQMAPISTARRNPFDLHYDSNEGMGLPPIPGSAPSVLAQRRNPFDIPYDPFEERPNLAGGSFEEEFMTGHEKDMHFRRYESFSVGSSFFAESKQEKPVSKFRPYFVPEQLHSGGIEYPTFQRQMSEISESKMSSVTEAESISSMSDQDNRKNVTERELSPPHVEPKLSQPIPLDELVPGHVRVESSSSDEADLVDDEEVAHERESTSPNMEYIPSPVGSDTIDIHMKPESVEEKHNKVPSSSSSEVNETISHVHTSGGLADQEPKSDDTFANDSAELFVADSNNGNKIEEGDDSHSKEPVYDIEWSPPEVEKTLSGVTIIEEALNYVDKRFLPSTSSIVSDAPKDALEVGSTLEQVERTISSMEVDSLGHDGSGEEEMNSGNEGKWAARSHLHTVEDNELRSREISMISECDVIQIGVPADNKKDGDVNAPTVPVTEQVTNDSGSSSLEAEYKNENLMNQRADDQLEQNPAHVDGPNSKVDAAGLKFPGGSSEDSAEIEMIPPLSEEPMVHSSGRNHDESQEPSSPVAVNLNRGDASDYLAQEDGSKGSPNHSSSDLIPSEIPFEIKYEHDLHDEIQNRRFSEVLEHSNVSHTADDPDAADKEFNVVEGIEEIDEDLLSELDAVGDFAVQEFETNSSQKESPLVDEVQESIMGIRAREANDSKNVEDDLIKSHDTVEAGTDMQGLGVRSIEEDHSFPKPVSVIELENQLEPTEDMSTEISAKKVLESDLEDKLDSKELVAENVKKSVKESKSEAEETHETLSSSNREESKTEGEQTYEVRSVDSHSTPEPVSLIGVEDQPKPTEDMSGVISARKVLESAVEDKLDSKELMAEIFRTGIEESKSEAEETYETSSPSNTEESKNEAEEMYEISSSSNTAESRKEIDLPAVGGKAEELQTNTSQTDNLLVVEAKESITGLQVLKDNYFKDTGGSFHRTQDSMEVIADWQDIDARSEEEFDSPQKQLSTEELEDQMKPTESDSGSGGISTSALESATHVNSNSEELMAEETKLSAKQSNSKEEDASEGSHSSRTDEPSDSNIKELETSKSEDVRVQESFTGLQVLEDNSSKDDSDKTKDSIEALAALQGLDPSIETETHLVPKQLSTDTTEHHLEPTESEEVQASFTGLQVLEDNSSNDVNIDTVKTKDLIHAPAALQGLEPPLEREMHLILKQLSVDKMEDQLKPAESLDGSSDGSAKVEEPSILVKSICRVTPAEESKTSTKQSSSSEGSAKIEETSIQVKLFSEDIPAEESKTSAKESSSEVEEIPEVPSKSTTIKKNRGSERSGSSSSSSSSDSD